MARFSMRRRRPMHVHRLPATASEAKRSARYRFWIPTGLSVAAILFTGFQFYYFNLRDVRKATMSIVAAEHTFLKDRNKSVLAIKAFITNGGTTPVALQQVVWTLSELPDPSTDHQRKIRWIYRPMDPVVIQGRSVAPLDFDFACYDTINGDFREVARQIMIDAPPFLQRNANFIVYYRSSISALIVDVDGDIHESTVRAGRLGFGGGLDDGLMYSLSLGDFRDLPLRLQLLPSKNLRGIKDLRYIWLPAHYSNFQGQSVGYVDTTGWELSLSESLDAAFRAWVDSTGMAVRP